MTRRWLVLLLMFGLALGLVLFGDKTPAGDSSAVVVPAVERQRQPAPSAKAAVTSSQAPTLAPREALWDDPQTREPIVDLFAAREWNPPPAPAASSPAEPPKPVVAAAPVAPPLPFTYLGKRLEDSTWEAFLGQGNHTLIVREGMVIDGTYRVESIKPPLLVLTYIPLEQPQTLAVGGID